MTAKKLNKEQIERVIYEKLTPITKHNQPYDPSMELTRWRPPDIRDHGSYLEMDGMKYAFYTLSYIRRRVSPGWLKKVIGIRADLDISITLRSVDKGDLVEEVNRKIVLLEEKLAGKLPPSFKNKYETQMKSLERLLDDLQDESENLFAVSFILAVRAETLEDLKSACNSLESEIRASRMRSKRLKHKGQYLMWYLLPIGFNNPNLEQKISWQLPAQTVASILPFNSSELNYQRGVLKGFNGANESPVIYDRFDDHIFYNPNEVVLGGSGSGKSFYLKVQIYREATEGNAERQFIIDPEREYLFGNRIIFKIGSGYVTNPFHIRSAVVDSDNETDETDLENYLSYKITQLVSFFRWIRPNMSELEEAFLLEGITKAYEQKGYSIENGWNGVSFHNENGQIKLNFNNPFPTLTDLDNELSKIAEAEMLRAALRPYVDGVYSSMFNGQTNWDMNDKINVLDIHELSESVQRPLMDLLIKDIWEEIKIDRKEKKGFIVDEAWILADENNQQSMEFLRSIAKRIRKYNGFLTVATQNIDDFLSVGKYGAALVKNAYIKTLMRMDEKDIEELSRFMNFSQKELRVIGKSKGRGYCIHITGNKRVEMRTDASPDEFKWLPLRKEGDKEVTAG